MALATVRSELTLLMSAGRWAGRNDPLVRRNAPPPDLFSSGFVTRIGESWCISAAGRAYLKAYGDGRFSVETPVAAVEPATVPLEPVVATLQPVDADPVAAKPVVVVHNPAVERQLPPLPPLRLMTFSRRPRAAGRR